MVGLWPSRSAESSAEASGSTSLAGSIEMKGSSRSDTKKPKPTSFWPVSSLRASKQDPGAVDQVPKKIKRPADLATDAAFVETIVKADTPTVLLCSPRGIEISPRSHQDGAENSRSSNLAISVDDAAADSGRDQVCCSPSEQQAIPLTSMHQPAAADGVCQAAVEQVLCDPEVSKLSAQASKDFHELQLVFRVPRPQPGNAALESSADALREQLELKEKQRAQAVDALTAKTLECENLLRIVRELTESRNRLSGVKAMQSERLADLQHDYMRLARVAELSRAVSRENVSKSAQTSQRLNQVEEELAHQKALNQQCKERHVKLKLENLELREKICLLERLDVFAYQAESACMLKFKQYHLKETY